MSRLRLTLACGDYDRTRALEEGTVRPDGIELTYLRLAAKETFFRMMRHQEFDCLLLNGHHRHSLQQVYAMVLWWPSTSESSLLTACLPASNKR